MQNVPSTSSQLMVLGKTAVQAPSKLLETAAKGTLRGVNKARGALANAIQPSGSCGYGEECCKAINELQEDNDNKKEMMRFYSDAIKDKNNEIDELRKKLYKYEPPVRPPKLSGEYIDPNPGKGRDNNNEDFNKYLGRRGIEVVENGDTETKRASVDSGLGEEPDATLVGGKKHKKSIRKYYRKRRRSNRRR